MLWLGSKEIKKKEWNSHRKYEKKREKKKRKPWLMSKTE